MKLDGFKIPYTEDQKLFSNVAVFDFESICVPTEELKATETTHGLENMSLFPTQYLRICKMFQFSCVKKIQNF